MLYLLIILATKQLEELVTADVYFEEQYIIEDKVTLGSDKNQIIIKDYCFSGEDLYLVGGAVRHGNYHGGLDAFIMKYNKGIIWTKVYGGSRDDTFEGIDCSNGLTLVGTSYSVDFIAESWNFKNGFIMNLDENGELESVDRIEYPIDITPTSVIASNPPVIGGYLDNFGNKDIFIYEKELTIYPFSGLDRLYDIKFDNGLIGIGSTTSKELEAVNINAAIYHFGENLFVNVYKSSQKSELIKFAENGANGYVGNNKLVYSDGIFTISESDYFLENGNLTVTNEKGILNIIYLKTISASPDVYDKVEKFYTNSSGVFYTYNKYTIDDVLLYTDYTELGFIRNNIKEEQYSPFTLLFSGKGLVNGAEVDTGMILQSGEYTFESEFEMFTFRVKDSRTLFEFVDIDNYYHKKKIEVVGNRKLLILPVILIGNLMYLKYQ